LGTTLDHENQDTRELPLNNDAVEAFIRAIERGEQSALIALYDKTSRLLFGLILKILGDRTSAEETLLEVYTHIWREPQSKDPALQPLEWLISLAHAQAVARLHWNKQVKRKAGFQARTLESAMTVAPDRQELARASIGALAPAQQEILGWAYYSGLSCSEIAAQIGKPIGAIKTHARLGLNKLSESFRPLFETDIKAGSSMGGDGETRASD
jgi:RNA polymerase sigma-70 factor, ECF subfamily